MPGLAEALRRPGIAIDAALQLTDGVQPETNIVLPDAIGTLAMKTMVRSVRTEGRDAEDLWRCVEIAAAEGVEPRDFDAEPALRHLREALFRELGPGGAAASALTNSLQAHAEARLRTRMRALLAEVVGARNWAVAARFAVRAQPTA